MGGDDGESIDYLMDGSDTGYIGGSLRLLPGLWNLTFCIKFLARKDCLISFEWQNEILLLYAPLQKYCWLPLEKPKNPLLGKKSFLRPWLRMFHKKQLGVLEMIVDRKGKTLVIQAWASEKCFPGGATRGFF